MKDVPDIIVWEVQMLAFNLRTNLNSFFSSIHLPLLKASLVLPMYGNHISLYLVKQINFILHFCILVHRDAS